MNEFETNLNRLVDGEMSAEQERSFLLECDHQDRWRDLALGFVESAALGAAVSRVELESFIPPRMDAADFMTNNRDDEGGAASWQPLMLVASVLIALSLGYGLGWQWNRGGDLSVANQPSEGNADQEKTFADRSMQFLVSDPGSDEMRQVNLPVLYASELGPDWESQLYDAIPDDLLREMRDAGIKVQQTRTVTRVRLPDGRRAVVPIDYFFEQPFQ